MRGDGPQRGAFALSKAISGPDVFVCSSFRSNAGGTRRALSRTPPTSSTRMCRSDGCHGDLEPSGYEFMALWTVYEMACFFVSLGGNVSVNVQLKLQQSSPIDSGRCLRFRSSTECWTSCFATETGTHSAYCAEQWKFHSAVLGWLLPRSSL